MNLPYSYFYAEDGTLKSEDELKAIFDTANIDLTDPVVFTYGAGVTATVGQTAALKAGATGKM